MLTRRETLAGGLGASLALAAPALAQAPERRAAFLAEVRRAIAAAGVPGAAVALVEDGRLSHVEGFGVRSAEGADPVDGDTLFRVGSVTKPFTALTLLRHVDAGRAALDSPVAGYLPEFRADGRVTPRHLLSSSSGLHDSIVARPDQGAGAAAAYAGEITTLSWDPGQWFSYCNPGFATVGALIERLGAAPYETQAQAVIDALGLERSTFDIGQVLTRAHTAPHRLAAGRATVIRPDRFAPSRHDMAAGMMFATARDLGRFAEWLLRGPGAAGVVSAGAFEQMKRPVRGLPPIAYGYGLGLATQGLRGEPVIGHGGNIWGHEAAVFVAPDRGFGVALILNAEDSGIGPALVDYALERLGGLPPVRSRPALRAEEHLGFYQARNPLTGETVRPEVVAVGAGVAVRGRNGEIGPVALPFGPDAYRRAAGGWAVFLRDASGRVVGVNSQSRHWLKV